MPDLFADGQQASRGAAVAQFEALQARGQGVLDALDQVRTDTLLRFENGLSALNSRRQRAARILSTDVACRFVVSDMLDIDQALSSATLRCDSRAVTLRERSTSAQAVVRSRSFSASAGTVEHFNGMYRVHMDAADAKPVGRFDLELIALQTLTLLNFDIVTLPSDPGIRVFLSADGLEYKEAATVSRNGYRVAAWFPALPARFVRIEIAPTHPDTLGGSAFTFGLTGFSAAIADFHMASELVTRPVVFHPSVARLRFKAASDPGLAYFLQFGSGPFTQVAPDMIVDLPGVSQAVLDDCQITADFLLAQTVGETVVPVRLPADIYPSSLRVLNMTDSQYRNLAYGFHPDPAAVLSDVYLAVHDDVLEICPVTADTFTVESGKTHRITYVHGPFELAARLKVVLTTSARAVTPVFKGAYLETIVD